MLTTHREVAHVSRPKNRRRRAGQRRGDIDAECLGGLQVDARPGAIMLDGRGRDEDFSSPAGSPEAVARPRLPQNVACGFPAPRSSAVGSQLHCYLKTLFQWPNEGGRSHQGLPVRAIHSTASTNSLLSLPRRPGSPGSPRQSGSIFAHWASVKTNRSIRSLNHNQARMRILKPQTLISSSIRGVFR